MRGVAKQYNKPEASKPIKFEDMPPMEIYQPNVPGINQMIADLKEHKKLEVGGLSDGYHTFDELYDHRVILFVAVCSILTQREEPNDPPVWKSKLHHDGTMYDGWFIAGIGTKKGKQISYHLPIDKWDLLNVQELEKAPTFDGHTPQDVLKRLEALVK